MMKAIELWYGTDQRFGERGVPQRWINLLGKVSSPVANADLRWSLEGSEQGRLSLGGDGHRLARSGDFNVEIPVDQLKIGRNKVMLVLRTAEQEARQFVHVHWAPGNCWPLPFEADLSKPGTIGRDVQVVDGFWQQTPMGLRSVEPYYDRVLAIGDNTWSDYEVSAEATLHAVTGGDASIGEGGTDVQHAAITVRWPGHDADEYQPHRKWWPMGAT
jgi:hypothetical protein